MSQAHEDNLIWIDLEMTGLDTDNDSILEIATIVTDKDLNVLAEGPVFAISNTDARLQQMDAWNRNQHMRSGLWKQVVESHTHADQAEEATIAFLKKWVPAGKSPMCGNSICQDRRFLHREMPKLERYFHYRNLDVSTLKELSRRWSPDIAKGFQKDSAHTALSDIRDSIDELRYYRRFMGAIGGQQPG
ncbi:oligoribonuclease [Rothia nasimurium]|uniref:Oligoribonuclease n=1 Tax=Luteibacter anthropi TaxID=564369 RepID=A0A7X5UAW6_9GAMM|nr:oligoribonuclease [Luteibacter anthropi]NII06987.1 oligoribonuclease [Luteibacter anthropi]